MGVVYQARDLKLNRVVALKMILAGAHAGVQQRQRFRGEAEAAARLQHPNIVQVYEVGEQEGCPYLSLEYVDGRSLHDVLLDRLPPPAEAAALAEQLARAADYAHLRGVVHRDLKPANVLLAADGTPKIADFGLAKRLDEGGAQTRTGDVLGTPSYMAPEQAAGKGKEVGPATDIYSLGAVLYEMLTGAPPFEGHSAWETVGLVLSAAPVPPARRNPAVPRDLETVCLKCLEKDPHRRYATGLALAEDLRRFRSGEPIEARPVGRLERGVKWARRRPALAGLLALSAALLLVLLVGGWVAAVKESRSNRALAAAHHGLQEADRANRRALVRLNVTNGTHYLEDEDLFGSLIWFARALRLEEDEARRPAHRTRIAAVLHECPRLGQLWFHEDNATDVTFSPDGRWVLTASDDHTARVWDVVTGKPRFAVPLRHDYAILRASFSPDGRRVVTASLDGTARLWDAATGRPTVPPLKHASWVHSASFSPEGRHVVTASHDHTARLWDASTGQPTAPPLRHGAAVRSAAFSPDGCRVVTASEDRTARLWDTATGQPVGPPLEHGHPREEVLDAVFSPDGSRVATGSANRTARLWDAASGKQVGRTMRHERRVVRVAFSPDGRRLATASADRTARLWDAASGEPLLPTPLQHAGPVRDVSFSPDGGRVVTSSDDNTVRVWSVVTGAPLLPPLRHFGSVATARFSADGKRLATASADSSGRVWDAATGEPLTPPLSHRGWGRVTDVAFSPDGDSVVTAGADGAAQVWRLGRTEWPAEDLERLAELLGGSRIGADAGSLVPLGAGALRRLWDELRTRHPQPVVPSP